MQNKKSSLKLKLNAIHIANGLDTQDIVLYYLFSSDYF